MFEINGMIWQVVIVSPNHPALTQPNGRQALGCCNVDERVIYISEKVFNSEMYRQVLIHEVAHAAIASYYIDLPIHYEEYIVDFVAVYGDEIFRIVDEIENRELIQLPI